MTLARPKLAHLISEKQWSPTSSTQLQANMNVQMLCSLHQCSARESCHASQKINKHESTLTFKLSISVIFINRYMAQITVLTESWRKSHTLKNTGKI